MSIQLIRRKFFSFNPWFLFFSLEFDVVLQDYIVIGSGATAGSPCRFQNNIQSIFSRVRLLYGATPLEDIIDYNCIVRMLTEWTSTNQSNTIDQVSISEGIGGVVVGTDTNVNFIRNLL